jgi:SAM-dependent methyltransferase
MALKRKPTHQDTRVEKPVYRGETQQSALLAFPALMWLLPQFLGEGGTWRVLPAILISLVVVWGGVATVISSTSWYRLGLDSHLIALAGMVRTSRSLNAACGTGSLAVSFAKAGGSGEVVATDAWKPTKRVPDPSQQVRDNIRIEGVGHIVQLQEVDPLALPFKAGRFNVVGSRFGISGARQDRRQMLMEMVRVIRPDGHLVLAESLPMALWLRYRVLPVLAADYKVSDMRLTRFHFTPIISVRKLG